MIQPTIVGSGIKQFTDCTTWNGGGTNPYLTTVTVNFYPSGGYSFQQGDIAIVVASAGMSTASSGWSQLVNGSNIEIWAKQLGSGDSFDSVWSNGGSGYGLWTSGLYGMVLRTPYSLGGLYYANNENNYSFNATSGSISIPAVSRPSFEDSDFYYRIDAAYAWEGYGSYYTNSYSFAEPAVGGLISSANCANTYEFLTTPPHVIGLSMFQSSLLSGSGATFYPQTVNASSSCNFATTTLWVRGWNPSSQGVML